jgi:uncharacterized protein YfkK (UPF0435 family)
MKLNKKNLTSEIDKFNHELQSLLKKRGNCGSSSYDYRINEIRQELNLLNQWLNNL